MFAYWHIQWQPRFQCLFKCIFSLNQGSFNRPHLESSSQSPSLSMDSQLKGLQVELSETCALCLSRLLSLISLPPGTTQSIPEEALASPPSDAVAQHISSSQQHLLFKLDCCLEDVNVFTLSNLAGKIVFLFFHFKSLECCRVASLYLLCS